MTRNEALKKAEENLHSAECAAASLSREVADRATARVRIAQGWLDLARELDKRA